jgi:hypothetical protein
MDEPDNSLTKSPEILAAEAARTAAQQRLSAARAQFSTPAWIGPARNPGEAVIPTQLEPDHDDELDEVEVVVPVVSDHPIPDTAHWAERARPRMLASGVLLASLAGVIGFLALAIITQSIGAIAGLVACAIVAVIFRGALMGSGVTIVDLKGSVLRIRKGGVLDIVNLADPTHRVELVGTPDQAAWRLLMEAVDGRVVELGPRQVDATEMHRIVTYYRAVAERERLERERRFNR